MQQIRDGKYDGKTATVWFGFDTYSRSVETMLEIIRAIKREYPTSSIDNMDIHTILPTMSEHHARMNMISMSMPLEIIKTNLSAFQNLE